MITLKSILQSLGCKKPFDKDGLFTTKGFKKFKLLEGVLYHTLSLVGVDDDTIDEIVDELSNIYLKEY